MKELRYRFSSADCIIYPDATLEALSSIVPGSMVVITDANVYAANSTRLSAFTCIVVPAGEQHKKQSTIDYIITELIKAGADRSSYVVALGGGVVTDMGGYAASIYMRGLRFGFVPTTILAMVDAAIGGKNGIDVGVYKNMVGTFRQPEFLLYDLALLQSLPDAEWVNGFAEIIKHACIRDAGLFDLLEQHNWQDFKNDPALLSGLVERNIAIKAGVVLNDEFEKGERKLLNFGHTLGHAIENLYRLPHGHAISIGMAAACTISEEINGFHSAEKERVVALLEKYGLPVKLNFDKAKVMEVLLMDKKKAGNMIHFILLNRIGDAAVQPVSTEQLTDIFEQIF